jgi:hypothetical protein
MNEVVPTTTHGSPFAYAASELSTSAAILKHRRGKFVTSDGDLPNGMRLAVLDIAFGWMRFNGPGVPPTKIYATLDHPKPDRAALGDLDESL